MGSPTRLRLLGAVMVVLICVGAVVVWQALGSDDAPDATAAHARAVHRDPTSIPVIDRVDAVQTANFSLLRGSPEGVPAATRELMGAPRYGASWELAQRLPVTAGGVYWVLPGDRHLCIVRQTPATVHTHCTTTREALEHGLASVTLRAQRDRSHTSSPRTIVGVAPDKAYEVIVHTGGSVVAALTIDDVFVLRDEGTEPPESLTLR